MAKVENKTSWKPRNVTWHDTATESYIANLQDNKSSVSTICPLGLWFFCLSSFQISSKAVGIHTIDMFLKASCVQYMALFFLVDCNSNILGSLENFFPVCYSGYVLTEDRHGAWLITQSTRKMMSSPSIHSQAPEHHKGAYGWCAGGSAAWTEVVYVSDQLEWPVTFPRRLWHFCRTGINTPI